MAKGYIHVYTGDGKGKSTAAFGLALRAACAEKKVYIGQFVKDMAYSETAVTEKYANITIEQLGRGCFISKNPDQEDIDMAESALERCKAVLAEGAYDLVILDEVFIAIFYNLLTTAKVLEILRDRASHVEVVLTGRYAPNEIIEYADLVTEMREIKHYYEQGVLSRKGIDC